MNQVLIFIIGVVGGVVLVWVALRFWKNRKKIGLIERQEEEKVKNKNKILEYFRSRERVSNDEIEKLLGVSDATATRYLDELEKQGLIRQVGRTGQSVYYERI